MAVTAVALASASSGQAWADEHALSVSAGLPWLSVVEEDGNEARTSRIGGMLALAYERALWEPVSLRADASAVVAEFVDHDGPAVWADASIGAVYRFDVLKYVPYVRVGVGTALAHATPARAGWHPQVTVGGGLDVLRSRASSWGVEARVTGFVTDATVMSFAARVSWRWGYF